MTLDDACLAQFQRRELGPEQFDHRGHLRIAWLHLSRYPLEEANTRVCDGIRDLAARLGAPDKFNYTLTSALMRIMAQRLRDDRQQDFPAFLDANRDLVADARGVVARHYSDACLNSPRARTAWVEPDIAPIG